jgi:hypothetical protein
MASSVTLKCPMLSIIFLFATVSGGKYMRYLTEEFR